MPTFKFEAMNTTGEEVQDSVEAASEEEAQQKIKNMGYFVTKITEMAGVKGKGKGGAKGKGKKKKKAKTFVVGGVSAKALCTFTRQFSTLQDAGLPVLRSLKILEHQMKPGVLKNALIDVVDDVESGTAVQRMAFVDEVRPRGPCHRPCARVHIREPRGPAGAARR